MKTPIDLWDFFLENGNRPSNYGPNRMQTYRNGHMRKTKGAKNENGNKL